MEAHLTNNYSSSNLYCKHAQCSNMTLMTRKSDQDKAWPPNTPGTQEAEDDIQQQTPKLENNTQGLGEQMQSATKQHRGIHKDTLHQPQNTNSLRDTGDKKTHMVFEGEPAVKFHTKNIVVGTSANGNYRQDQVIMGRVHNPGSTNHQSLSFIRIDHAPVIAPLMNPSQVPVRGASNSRSVCWLANNCQ